jgi:hypothetical protein
VITCALRLNPIHKIRARACSIFYMFTHINIIHRSCVQFVKHDWDVLLVLHVTKYLKLINVTHDKMFWMFNAVNGVSCWNVLLF